MTAGADGARCGSHDVGLLNSRRMIAARSFEYGFASFLVGFPYDLLHVSSTLSKEVLHHLSEFGWVVHHDRASIPKDPSLRLCQVLTGGRPSTRMTHYSVRGSKLAANE